MSVRREVALAAALAAALALAGAARAAGEVLLYRGEFVFVVPKVIGDEMLEIAGPDAWKPFWDFTRYIDADDDGVDDFVAVAIGNDAGYGVQVRYRLRHEGDRTRLGTWFWGAIVDDSGRKVFESFND